MTRALVAGLGLAVLAPACRSSVCGEAPTSTAAAAACLAACPRDSSPDGRQRCACNEGGALVLGACVPPSVGDAYCGPAARLRGAAGGMGCAFLPCRADEALDVDRGCVSLGEVAPRVASSSCAGPGEALLVDGGQIVCVPAEVACPRGTRLDGKSCAPLPACPPGSVPAPQGSGGKVECRPVMVRGPRGPVVDVGRWTALVIGADGGPGSPDLCRPIAQHPATLGVRPGETATLAVRLRLLIPDQDTSRVHAQVDAQFAAGAGRPPKEAAPTARMAQAEIVAAAVAGLVEPLRGLGGETSAASVDVEVRCAVQAL